MEEFQYNEVNSVSDTEVRGALSKTFLWMFLGVLATAITAVYTYSAGIAETMAVDGTFAIICIAQIAIALIMGFLLRKLSATMITILFFAYSMLTGVTLSTIFYVFEISSITIALFGSAALFGGLAILGYNSNRDVTSLGSMLTIGLIIGLVLSIINLFLGNPLLDIALDWAILAIFLGFTYYDMNNIKMFLSSGMVDTEKVSVYGAFQLYLDFINIFLRILSIFGERRN